MFFGRHDAKAESPVLWPPHAKSWLIGKDSDAGRDWGQEEKGTTEDERAGWHHWLDRREFEWTLGVGDGTQPSCICHPLLLLPSIFPSIRIFLMSQLFALGGQSIGALASASVLPMNIQDWFPLGSTDLICLQSKGLSRVFFSTTVQKHQFFGAQPSSQSNSHIYTRPQEKPLEYSCFIILCCFLLCSKVNQQSVQFNHSDVSNSSEIFLKKVSWKCYFWDSYLWISLKVCAIFEFRFSVREKWFLCICMQL